jgi:hypothetical protein
VESLKSREVPGVPWRPTRKVALLMETTFFLIYFNVLNLFDEGNVFCILKFLIQSDSREIFFNLAIIPMEYSRAQYSMESSPEAFPNIFDIISTRQPFLVLDP